MKNINLRYLILTGLLLPAISIAEQLDVTQLIQRVIDHHPSVRSAAIQVKKAQQVSAQVQSQLGWQLAAQGGVSRDISFFGTPTDALDASASLNRLMESGSSMSVSGGLQYSDSETSAIPSLPNPATSTNIEFRYRQPLGKGADNPAITEGLASAKAGLTISGAQVLSLYDQLASQIIELYGAALTIEQQIINTDAAIKRTRRLQKYLQERSGLGISEEKDLLQVEAQLNSQLAQRDALNMARTQQQISFNRLMGNKWNNDLQFKSINLLTTEFSIKQFEKLFADVSSHNPQLKVIAGQIALADSKIKSQRDAKKDKLDLVLFIGNKTSNGDSTTGSVSESDVVGGARLEFLQSVDSSGADAALYDAQLERGLAIQEKRKTLEDLHYDLVALLAEIDSASNVVKAYQRSLKSEIAKLNEAEERYRSGRTDTDTLIQFENQKSATDLTLSLQKIELQKAYLKLSLLRGKLMKDIKLPEFDLSPENLFEQDATAKGEQS